MKRAILALGLALTLMVGTVHAEAIGAAGTASTASQTVTINAPSIIVHNDSTSLSLWVRVFWEGETPADATAAVPSVEIKYGEAYQFQKSMSIKAVSLITASSTVAYRIVSF